MNTSSTPMDGEPSSLSRMNEYESRTVSGSENARYTWILRQRTIQRPTSSSVIGCDKSPWVLRQVAEFSTFHFSCVFADCKLPMLVGLLSLTLSVVAVSSELVPDTGNWKLPPISVSYFLSWPFCVAVGPAGFSFFLSVLGFFVLTESWSFYCYRLCIIHFFLWS